MILLLSVPVKCNFAGTAALQCINIVYKITKYASTTKNTNAKYVIKKIAKNLRGNERKATGKTYKHREMSDL